MSHLLENLVAMERGCLNRLKDSPECKKKVLNRLRSDMFETFACFEYALKAAGFHNGNGPAEPNWFAFAKSPSAMLRNGVHCLPLVVSSLNTARNISNAYRMGVE